MVKIGFILLQYARPKRIGAIMNMLQQQTRQDFHLIVSNSNPEGHQHIRKIVKRSRPGSTIRLDSNDLYSFRRLYIGRELANQYDVYLMLDDDVTIPPDYVEKVINQYEPGTYKSWWAWNLNGKPYKLVTDRTRVTTPNQRVDYGGTGVSMIDAQLLTLPEIFDYPPEAVKIEDIWLSYVLGHIHNVPITYLDVDGVELAGADNKALYRQISRSNYTKADFVDMLRARGWTA